MAYDRKDRENYILIGSMLLLGLVLLATAVSALSVEIVDSPTLTPGQEGTLRVNVDNTLNTDIEDVSLVLNFQGMPLSPISSSEASVDEIENDDDEDFTFLIRASPTATPGDYQIPYSLTYKNSTRAQSGTLGIRITGSVELQTIVTADKPVLNEKGKLTLKIINKGFADARYVSLTLTPEGYGLYSDKTIYIGDISANDFETASFDVIFTKQRPKIEAVLEYRDFDNNLKQQAISEPITVYTREQAIERGIIKKNNTPLYVGIAIALIIIWLIVRALRKRARKRRSMQRAMENE